MDKIKQYEPLWGSWYVEEKIGSGGFGAVYKVSKQIGRVKEYAAVKLIRNVIDERQQLEMRKAGMSGDDISKSLDRRIRRSEDEIIHMSRLRGVSEIVNIDDFSIFKLEDKLGYDILIRMELLTSLDEYLLDHFFSKEEVCHLGIDICTALEYCEKVGIVHKDIKPGNIFINPKFGNYELGDFGLARRTEHSTVMSKSGTPNYISPEVSRMEKAGYTSDIYCLGLTLYSLLNHNRLPFDPPYPEFIDVEEREAAVSRRINGEELPPPDGDQGELWKIIEKACMYRREDRYQHAYEMKENLLKYLAESQLTQAPSDLESDQEIPTLPAGQLNPADRYKVKENINGQNPKKPSQKPGKRIKLRIVFISIVILFFIFIVIMLFTPDSDREQLMSESKTVSDDLFVGDTVIFGTYEQDNDESDGKEDIIWRVLKEKDGKILLISEYGLDGKPYDEEYTDITWEECTLRTWLNHDFYDSAFTDEEKSKIISTELKAMNNSEYGTEAGKDTKDQVFLLGEAAAKDYFSSDESRECKPTPYAVNNGVKKDIFGECGWWLRSPGSDRSNAIYVDEYGTVCIDGCEVDSDSTAVRPVIWITP